MKDELNLNSLRARKARLSAHIGKVGFESMVALIWIFGLLSIYLLVAHGLSSGKGFLALGLSLLSFSLAIWDKWDLQTLPPAEHPKTLDDFIEPRLLTTFKNGEDLTPRKAWDVANKNWEAHFLCNHLLLDPTMVAQTLPGDAAQMQNVWQMAHGLMASSQGKELNSGTLAAALIISSPATMDLLAKMNLKVEDIKEVYSWLERISKSLNQRSPSFGGIGRDWATGFTPTLDRFGSNISKEIEAEGGHFHTLAHSDILNSVIHNLNSGAVGLVGEAGSGKTSLVYALAQRLLEGKDEGLRYYQIISLDASAIISSAKEELEKIILTLFAEASHARNIIIFLDEAQLFFGTGTGAFDISKILLPLVQNRSVRLIAALTPDDFQTLKSSNPELIAFQKRKPQKPTCCLI
jgi:hypothetical protein